MTDEQFDPSDNLRRLMSLPTEMMTTLAGSLQPSERRAFWEHQMRALREAVEFCEMKLAELDGMTHAAGVAWPDTVPAELVEESPSLERLEQDLKDAKAELVQAQREDYTYSADLDKARRGAQEASKRVREAEGRYPWLDGDA